MGGSARLASAVLRTRAALDFATDETWLPLFAKLANDDTFELNQLGPVTDFVAYELRRRGSFSMKRRTIDSVVASMHAWHRELGELRNIRAYGIARNASWTRYTGAKPLKGESLSITEICSVDELFEEGRLMRHCVVSYVHDCLRGATSIWAVTPLDSRANAPDTRATVRLDVARARVVEARSVANRPISEACRRFIARWADRHGLDLQYE